MNKWQARINEYLAGTMDAADLTAFEEAMRNDSALREAVTQARMVDQALDALAEDTLREEMHMIQSIVARGRRMRMIIGLAVTILILAIVYFELDQKQHKQREALFAQFYQAPLDEARRDQSIAPATDLEKGIDLFHAGDLETSKRVLGQSEEPAAQYYLAHALIAQDSLMRARYVMNRLESDPEYSDKAGWFELLTYLKAGEMQQFESALSAIVESTDHEYHDKALRLQARVK